MDYYIIIPEWTILITEGVDSEGVLLQIDVSDNIADCRWHHPKVCPERNWDTLLPIPSSIYCPHYSYVVRETS